MAGTIIVDKVQLDVGQDTLRVFANTGSTIFTANTLGINAASLGFGTVPVAQIPQLTTAKMPTGSVLQVVSNTTTTQTEASFSSATDLGLSASITPTSSSSKILVLVSANGLGTRGSGTNWNGWVVRASTNIGAFCNYVAFGLGSGGWGASVGILDNPATTSSTTYKLQGQRQTGSDNCFFNISTGSSGTGTISTITLLEIAA